MAFKARDALWLMKALCKKGAQRATQTNSQQRLPACPSADDMLDFEEFSRAFDLFMDAKGQPSNFQVGHHSCPRPSLVHRLLPPLMNPCVRTPTWNSATTQTSLLAADCWALLAACHDYEIDAQRAQDDFEVERARLEAEVCFHGAVNSFALALGVFRLRLSLQPFIFS